MLRVFKVLTGLLEIFDKFFYRFEVIFTCKIHFKARYDSVSTAVFFFLGFNFNWTSERAVYYSQIYENKGFRNCCFKHCRALLCILGRTEISEYFHYVRNVLLDTRRIIRPTILQNDIIIFRMCSR